MCVEWICHQICSRRCDLVITFITANQSSHQKKTVQSSLHVFNFKLLMQVSYIILDKNLVAIIWWPNVAAYMHSMKNSPAK